MMPSLKSASTRFVFCVVCMLTLVSVSRPAFSDNDVLKKWGVTPGQAGAGDLAAGERRQPMVHAYPYWMAAKFIPDFFDDKTVLQFVEKEIDYSKRYKRSPDARKPWLSYEEVKDRHPRMAAPEFADRYKADVRKFVEGLSTRVNSQYKIGRPNYNRATGMMYFDTGYMRPDADKKQLTSTILAGQQRAGAEVVSDYAALRGAMGEQAANRVAEKTVGRKLGWLGTYKATTEKVRPPGDRVPMILESFSKKVGINLLAYDKDIISYGIKMSRGEAEKFLNKYERTTFIANVNYKVTDAFRYFHKATTYKGDAVVFQADVEDVSIYAYVRVSEYGKSEIQKVDVAHYKASDFKTPTDTYANQRIQYENDIKGKQQQAARVEQARNQEIADLKKECAASESFDCYKKLCAKVRETGDAGEWQSCNTKMQQANAKRIAAIRNAGQKDFTAKLAEQGRQQQNQISSQRSRAACENKFSGQNAKPWMPVKGSPEYTAAVTACLDVPVREPYGPDVLGLRLGMTEVETRDLLRRQQVKGFAQSTEARPFEEATLQWTREGNHGIGLFFVNNGDKYNKKVAAISRRLYADGNNMTAEQVVGGLREKYGRELWSGSKDTFLWTFPDGSNKASAKMCSGLTKLLEPRAGWTKDWGGGRSSDSRQTRREKREQDRAAKMTAYNACISEFGGAGAPMSSPPDMAKMQELQRCIQEMKAGSAPASSGSSESSGGKGVRLPMMVPETGSPATYEPYKGCGPVAIARMNKDGSGALSDVSLVLFDSEWIASQPAFFFKSSKSSSQIQF